MARVKRSYAATETVVQWVLGTRPGGDYYPASGTELTGNREDAKPFLSEPAAREFAALTLGRNLSRSLRVIRVSRTTRESCEG